MKIAFRRWNDVDQVFEARVCFEKTTESADFYRIYLQEDDYGDRFTQPLNLEEFCFGVQFDKTVHLVTPLADEYQTTKTLQKADDFLSKKSRQLGDRISSQQVISNILQAESNNLTSYLEESIAIASRKLFSRLVANPKFKEISSETRMKIAFKRWSDIDRVFESSGNLQGITESTDFYLPYQMQVVVPPLMGGQSRPSGPHLAKPSTGPSGFSFGGQSGIVPTQDLNFNLKQFMQRN
ncbi:unnamed protein product [Mytilus coruscus]|uniref:Uncharacterized protein n=1 Tax=Mytilus coruscus TaxID=42192 RepID=A0A6J8BBF8_MYTCO|nr:unnamed protein product [Mytilus coruscus]